MTQNPEYAVEPRSAVCISKNINKLNAPSLALKKFTSMLWLYLNTHRAQVIAGLNMHVYKLWEDIGLNAGDGDYIQTLALRPQC